MPRQLSVVPIDGAISYAIARPFGNPIQDHPTPASPNIHWLSHLTSVKPRIARSDLLDKDRRFAREDPLWVPLDPFTHGIDQAKHIDPGKCLGLS